MISKGEAAAFIIVLVLCIVADAALDEWRERRRLQKLRRDREIRFGRERDE